MTGNKKIAIIIPTRSRIKSLNRAIDTAFNMASNSNNIGIFLYYDSDDPETKQFISKKKTDNPDWNIYEKEVYIDDQITKEGINIHDRYFNPGARWAVELGYDYIWGAGNDVEIITQDYDKILELHIEQFLKDKPDRIVYVAIDADNNAMRSKVPYCPFHIFTSETVVAYNGTQPSEITSWGADSATFEIFKQIENGNRMVGIPEVSIKHWSYHTGRKHGEEEQLDGSGCDGDSISYRLSTRVMHLNHNQKMWYINRLREKIKKG